MNKNQRENFCRSMFALQNKSNKTISFQVQNESSKDTWELITIEKKLQRIAELFCSEQMDGKKLKRLENQNERLGKQAKLIADKWNLRFYRQGDCRGCQVYLYDYRDVPEGQSIGSVYDSIGIAFCL